MRVMRWKFAATPGGVHQDCRPRRLEQLPSVTIQGLVAGRHALGEAHQFRPELDADGGSFGIPVDRLQAAPLSPLQAMAA